MAKYVFDYTNDFTGGENSYASPDLLMPGQSQICENVDLFGVGGFKRRTGISEYKLIGSARTDRLIEYEYKDFGIRQVETITVVGNITASGTAKVIVTANGMMNSPKTINVSVVNGDTAAKVASKIKKALNADTNVSAFFAITSSSATITLTTEAAAADDATMNISVENGTCTGLTAVPTSVNTNMGEAPATEPVLKKLALTGNQLINVVTGEVLKSDLGRTLDYVVYKNKLYMLTSGMFLVYDGRVIEEVDNEEADSNLLNIRKCKYIEQRGERLFAAGNPEDANALYFSQPGDPTYWKVISVVQAITADADRITALKEYHGALIAFKERAVYAWFGYNPEVDVEFQKLSVHTGTLSYRSIASVGDALMYLGTDGVYALVGTYKDVIVTKKVSKNMTKRMSGVVQHEDTACAIYHDGKYMLSIPTGEDPDVNDKVFVLFTDLLNKQDECWVVNTGWNISDWLLSLDGKLYSASSATGRVHRHDKIYNDLGAGIAVRVKMRPLSQDAPIHNKKYKHGYIAFQQFEAVNTHLSLEVFVDYNKVDTVVTPDESLMWDNDVSVWDNANWDFTELSTKPFKIREKGKRITIDMFDDTADEEIVVYGCVVEYKVKRPDKGGNASGDTQNS